MKVLLILLMTWLVGCGSNYIPEDVPTPPIEPNFEGAYYFDHNGFIELSASYDGEVIIESTSQSLTSLNPQNNTLAYHPAITGKYEPHFDEVRFVRNVNYTAGQDIEEDVSGADIVGSRRTDVSIKLTTAGIKITVKIYNASLNNDVDEVVATRVFESL